MEGIVYSVLNAMKGMGSGRTFRPPSVNVLFIAFLIDKLHYSGRNDGWVPIKIDAFS